MSDIRFAFRALRGAPMVSMLAIACIGLGIGAVTTVYSTATAFTFRPLPQLVDADELMLIAESPTLDRLQGTTVAAGTLRDVEALPEFAGVAAFMSWTANVAGFDIAERVPGAKVSADFFSVAGRTVAAGRTFNGEDVRGDSRSVILSDGLWRRRFGADPEIIGRSVQINGQGHEVVGIMPDDFVFPAGARIWTPLALSPAAAADRSMRTLFVLARRAPDVSSEQANASAMALGARIAAQYPATHSGWTIRAVPAEEFFGAGPRPFMIVLLSAVAFLLLIACANVANLLLARATARRREMAQRLALGATRGRLVIQLLTESMVLACAGGLLGIGLGWLGIRGTAATVPLEVRQYIPGFGNITLDFGAMLVAALVTMAAGLVFGLVPAVTGSSVDVNSALKDTDRTESPRSRLLRNVLVVGEIALALALVTGAALMASTFRHVSMTDPGFRTTQILTGIVTLPDGDYATDRDVVNFWQQLRESLDVEPGVEAAELTSVLPMSWNDSRIRVYPEGEAPARVEDAQAAGFRRVSPGYLAALGVTLVGGRGFAETDRQDALPVVVLSETAARRLLPGRTPVGSRLVIRNRPAEVVGVARDVRANPLTSDSPTFVVYAPMSQWPARSASVVLRTSTGDPTGYTSAMQRAIARLDPRLAAGEVATMERVIETVTSPQSATAQMLLVSALIALVMAAVGTYGVMAYSVARRTREIGLRIALGATRGQVVRQIVGSAARLATFGLVLGLAGAVALGWSMQAILVDTDPRDPLILTGAAAALATIALAAGWLPARRASRVNPVRALRAE